MRTEIEKLPDHDPKTLKEATIKFMRMKRNQWTASAIMLGVFLWSIGMLAGSWMVADAERGAAEMRAMAERIEIQTLRMRADMERQRHALKYLTYRTDVAISAIANAKWWADASRESQTQTRPADLTDGYLESLLTDEDRAALIERGIIPEMGDDDGDDIGRARRRIEGAGRGMTDDELAALIDRVRRELNGIDDDYGEDVERRRRLLLREIESLRAMADAEGGDD